MSLDDIVQLSITVQDAAVSRAGFGTPLVMTHEAPFGPELVRSYANTAAMVSDGFAASGQTVAAVTAILAQNPKVPLVKVGVRTSTPVAMTRVISVDDLQNSTAYKVTINGTEFSFTSDATATALEIMAGLTSAINGGSEPVTATDNLDGTMDLVADVAGTEFGLQITSNLAQDDTTADAGVAADYAAIKLDDSDFYGVLMTSSATAEITALAAAVEADRKLFGAHTQDEDVKDDTAGNLGEVLNGAAYQRTYLVWSGENFDYAAAAIMGNRFPSDPGSSTWKFKTPAGVTADSLSPTEISNLDSNKVNHVTTVGGNNIFREGTVASGRFIDIVRGIDWLHARLQERIFGILVNVEKIPFTDPGIALVEGAIRAQLEEGIANGLLAADPAPTVTVPLAADVSANDKALRLLPDIEFTATLAGAVHRLVIAGTVSV